MFSTQEYLKIKSSKVCITSIAIYFLRRESTISLSQDYIATDSKLVYTSCIKYMRKMLFWVNNFTGLASLQLIHFLQSQKISLAWQLFDSVEFITGFVSLGPWASPLIEVIELIKYWIMNVEGVCTWSKNRLFTSRHCEWRSWSLHVASNMYLGHFNLIRIDCSTFEVTRWPAAGYLVNCRLYSDYN